MKLATKSSIQTLNRHYRREKVHPQAFEAFLESLDNYFYYTNRAKEIGETTENIRKYVGDFLAFFFPDFYQNTKLYHENHETDWIIGTQNEEQTNVQIVVKIKNTDDKSEMITTKKLNCKGFWELVMYYLWEQIEYENEELKYLIITNVEDFYLFDTTDFRRLFYQHTGVVEAFKTWKSGKINDASTKKFYDYLKKIIKKSADTLTAIHINLYDYQKAFEQKESEEGQRELVEIYKLFSPNFLLKQQRTNKSNRFNQTFYDELLHILGLEEKIVGTKKVITRCETPNVGSILENTITKLRTEDLLYNLRQPNNYGKTDKEQYFSVALELVITWFNRILFLKILEAQLVSYNADDTDKDEFRFLNPSKVQEFDTLNTLFFEVLALPEKEREKHITKEYGRIPYLNSSLFEVTALERQTLRISNIKDSTKLPLHQNSILTNDGDLPTLDYLLTFLDAYDFGLSDSESVLGLKTKPLINTTILGFVLEKLNGYKEGAYFTPAFVTMYMSRETLRRVVIEKFNVGFGMVATTFEAVREYCQNLSQPADLIKVNQLINTITICDPAVGSGHFLIGSLHELLVIKSELGVLCDLEGKSLKNEITLKIENDELVIYDNLGIPFSYKLSFAKGFRKLMPKLQRIQEAIFHEKKYLIEHSLFGVDINPNSVKICQLRLWIELLKNTYYRQRRNTQLETLPNIDINIKTGNALISRFALNADLNDVFRRIEYSVEEYKRSVKSYKIEENKREKRKLFRYLEDIKSEFRITFDKREKEKIAKVRGKKDSLELQIRYNKNLGYEPTKKELEELQKLRNLLLKKENEKTQILESEIYENAFEWRFEFPEILDENGTFVGFDVVIGNPPNIRQVEMKSLKWKLKKQYQVFQSTADSYIYFFELGVSLLRKNGIFHMITPNKWLRTNSNKPLRQFLKQKQVFEIIDFGGLTTTQIPANLCMVHLNNETPQSGFKILIIKELYVDFFQQLTTKKDVEVITISLTESLRLLK